ncbi:hypothetical protein VFPPC_16464 [Pochonia chlamydosporia 170]|uniref:Uncharacterized protein n=1 Tax=Pochonia chlamydosporia 170 TaxID=1380566 RepID=A0A179FDP5_METCM|nr:hypothetical protein VFPPC_16464 [Pochonia chlamydosporia 170]OAQ63361.1 hypothetical protein VFPPC_16464 [Pochonia chlamydosporia 170]
MLLGKSYRLLGAMQFESGFPAFAVTHCFSTLCLVSDGTHKTTGSGTPVHSFLNGENQLRGLINSNDALRFCPGKLGVVQEPARFDRINQDYSRQ